VAKTPIPEGKDYPPQAWAGLAATQPASVLLKTARRDPENQQSLFFSDASEILTTDCLQEIPAIFASIEQALRSGYYVAGFLSYEAGYHFEPAAMRSAYISQGHDVPLAWFGVYRKPLTRDEFKNPPAGSPHNDPVIAEPEEISISISRAEYGERIRQIQRYIEAGDLYQANFTLMMHQRWSNDAGALFETMMENQPVSYGALINTGQVRILSASPELFFRKQGSRIIVRPMKGTCDRGCDLAEDLQRAQWLAGDPKNRAENVMIVDLLRSDLGRFCTIGSIKVTDMFAVEHYPDLLQMTSTVQGNLNPGTSYYEIFRSLFPCGSITGAPKIRTMQIIRQLEGEPRGIACGAIGFFSPAGDAVFSVAIRTLTLNDGQLQMRVGSGITYDSDAETEYAECLLKSQFLSRRPQRFELIETIGWANGYFLLELHLQRLKASAEYFRFPFDLENALQYLQKLAQGFQKEYRCRVRLLLSKSGLITVTSTPLTALNSPASLLIAAERTDSSDVFLRHKTTQRHLYDAALDNARSRGFTDALFLNERGEVTECAIHNVMIAKDGEFITPPTRCGLLPGVYRQHLLATHPKIREAIITLNDVMAADHVFIFNSVRGLKRTRIAAKEVALQPSR
jgi:para-aminobenzoate synthetase / 4-amino-4-deoxychorismate lyase